MGRHGFSLPPHLSTLERKPLQGPCSSQAECWGDTEGEEGTQALLQLLLA